MDNIRGSQYHDQMYSGHQGGRGKTSNHQDLRSLLDTENAYNLTNLANGCHNTYWGNAYGGRPLMGYSMMFLGDCRCGTCDPSHEYTGYRYKNFWFCAPPGTTNITFELWGGGGAGGKGCCCMQGNPGGAGAYAIKTLCACCNPATGEPWPGGTFGGMCWEVFVAPSTQDSTNCKGFQGCKSYVTGCGLSNFCADGGMPGKTCCFAWNSGRVCGQADSVGIHTYSAFGTQNTTCLNEYRPCYPMTCSGMYTFHPCEGPYTCDCACYYGADWGVPGKLGWFRSDCADNWCMTKIGMPEPGGMTTRCTRFHIQSNWFQSCVDRCRFDSNAGEFTKDCRAGMHPGKGGMSGSSEGGDCNGWRGSPGLVRIHYF